MRTIALLAAMLLALAGCGVLRSIETGGTEPWIKPDMPRPASDLESLLLYFQHVKQLPGVELNKEQEAARQAYSRMRSDFSRVRLAMVLSLPNTAFSDDARALELLEPMIRNQNSTLHSLAFLMNAYVQEKRRLGASAFGMQQKLDALKSLERSLIEREQGGQRRR